MQTPNEKAATRRFQWERCDCDRTYHDECPIHGVYGDGRGPSGKLPEPAPGHLTTPLDPRNDLELDRIILGKVSTED